MIGVAGARTGPVLIAGSEAQKQHYVRGVATGEMRAGFGLSEPQAGSDVVGMRTEGHVQGARFGFVVELGRGTVRVDIVHFFDRKSCRVQGALDGLGLSGRIRRG